MEEIEIKMLKNADLCTICGEKMEDFRKYISGTRWHWAGWCNNCQKDQVTVCGNTPKESDL